ncbi:MAG: orotidine-5'-phosphate decarboxylase [Anaerolineales bacterium]
METFFSFLERRVDDCSSLLCIGLDPHINDLSAPTAASALDFCVNIVRQTSRYAAAFKPNAAFFEVFGPEGWTALRQVIEAVQDESNRWGSMIPVILDAKRGDIASTAEAYAKSAFENLGAHCITLNPYLGKDSIEPFLHYPEKGVFLLCKTSNAGAGDLQDLLVLNNERGKTKEDNLFPLSSFVPLHIKVAQLAQSWNTHNNIGLVVGVTYPETLARVREVVPDMWFLSPGVGAQGGELELALKAGLRKDGKGMLINVARSIGRAPKPGIAVAELRDQILNIKRELNH